MLLDLARSNRNEWNSRRLAAELAVTAAEHHVTASQYAVKRDMIHLQLLQGELTRATQALHEADHGVGKVRGRIRNTGIPVQFAAPEGGLRIDSTSDDEDNSHSD